MTHALKIRPEYFEAVQTGRKPFELRWNDRGFRVGDLVELREWDGERYTGRTVIRCITYTLNPCSIMDCEPGYLVLGLGEASAAAPAADMAPVLHGQWIPISDGAMAECSGCGEAYEVSENGGITLFKLFQQFYKYCPNCGTKMDL